jgi:CHAD domain-containing protein
MARPLILAFTGNASTDALRRRLAPAFRLRAEGAPTGPVERLYIDTFDWRLFARGLLLYLEEDTLVLSDGNGRRATEAAPGLDRRLPCFAVELPPGELRSGVEPVGRLRALLPAGRLSVSRERYAVRDDIDKTIGHLTVERPTEASAPAIARLEPLRGFSREAAALARAAEPTARAISEAERRRRVLAAGGREPGAYTTKVSISLSPQTPAADAARQVMGHFLAVMRENEAGLTARTDTEFLHDYRIALRRLRSYVSLAKGTFAPEVTRRLKADLKRVAALTGPARDFDVLLLRRDEYRALLPQELEGGLDHFFEWVRARTDEAYGRLTAFMATEEYHRITGEWAGFAAAGETPAEARGEHGNRPIGSLAPGWLSKQLGRVAEGIDAVAGGAPDERMHELRKDGKKLRYLIEILASLYPPKTGARLVKQLKAFQDALGDLNDLSVQELTLKQDLTEIRGNDPRYVEIAASIGGLLTELRRRRAGLYGAYEAAAARYRSEIGGGAVKKVLRQTVSQGEPV